MVCSNCKSAGKLNTDANRVNFESVADAEKIRVKARKQHARCSDTKCPCQHVIGDVINHERGD